MGNKPCFRRQTTKLEKDQQQKVATMTAKVAFRKPFSASHVVSVVAVLVLSGAVYHHCAHDNKVQIQPTRATQSVLSEPNYNVLEADFSVKSRKLEDVFASENAASTSLTEEPEDDHGLAVLTTSTSREEYYQESNMTETDAEEKTKPQGEGEEEEGKAVLSITREEYYRDNSTNTSESTESEEAVLTTAKEADTEAVSTPEQEPAVVKETAQETYDTAAKDTEESAKGGGRIKDGRRKKAKQGRDAKSSGSKGKGTSTPDYSGKSSGKGKSSSKGSSAKGSSTMSSYKGKGSLPDDQEGKGISKGKGAKGKGIIVECIPLDQTPAPTSIGKGKGKGKGFTGKSSKTGKSSTSMKTRKTLALTETSNTLLLRKNEESVHLHGDGRRTLISEDAEDIENGKKSMMKKKKKKMTSASAKGSYKGKGNSKGKGQGNAITVAPVSLISEL